LTVHEVGNKDVPEAALFDTLFTVHCKLDNLGHQSTVRPGNGTGRNPVKS
jgi:hypothetical protein